MMGLGLGRLGSIPRAISAAFSPAVLWPLGASSPGLWIDPAYVAASFQDSAGTTALSAIGTVADSANPVGLILDRKGGLVLGPELAGLTAPAVQEANWTDIGGGSYTSDGGAGYIGWSGLVVGKTYEVVIVVSAYVSGQILGNIQGPWFPVIGAAGTSTSRITATGTGASLYSGSFLGTIESVSVKEILGLHMLQATSTARPLASARRNLLTATEDFADGAWTVSLATGSGAIAKTPNYAAAPDGTTTACRVVASRTGADFAVMRQSVTSGGLFALPSAWIKSNTGASQTVMFGNSTTAFLTVTATTTWQRLSGAVQSAHPSLSFLDVGVGGSSDDSIDVSIWHPQLELGTTATDYQSVTSASDYDASVAPVYQQYDGTDDGHATVTVTADTVLTAGMDAIIAIRRDSAANAVCGLYESVAEANKVFGIAESASGSGCVGSGAGTPAVWADGVQLTGGTAVTRGTLHTALTAGDWHILEFRNLDLSTWTAAGFGLYTSYVLNGGRGPIMLFESGQDANRDLARAEMAAYFGVTLP